jgi:hypothetical protein
VVAAGATGTLSAKLRRITTDLGTALTNWTTLLARIPAALSAGGGVKVGLSDALPAGANAIGVVDTELPAAAALANGAANPTAPAVGAHSLTWNGFNWDRFHGNSEITGLAAAARTASVNTTDQTLYNGRGIRVYVNVTVYGGAGSLTVNLKVKDQLAGGYFLVLASAPIVATGLYCLTVYPGIAAVANVAANDVLSRVWRAEVVAADATSHTYSLGLVHLN